jgi:hypothetical protein
MEQAVEAFEKYCDQCGTGVRLQARFCGRCGVDVRALAQPTSLGLAAEGPAFQPEAPEENVAPSMDLGMAWMIYGLALLLWLGTLAVSWGVASTVIYLIAGFVMTRFLMRGLIAFHPLHNTVANVFSAKIWMFLLWPLQMFILLFKLTVSGAL